MDFVKNLTGGNKEGEQKPVENKESGSGGGFMDKINSMAGGGKESEKNEDSLDKGKPPPLLTYYSSQQLIPVFQQVSIGSRRTC
jgi:hypothetical protein